MGVIHDFDYEMYPNAPDHPLKGSEILKEKGVTEEIRSVRPPPINADLRTPRSDLPRSKVRSFMVK